ncbi:MAG: ATP-binding cassette domain-containing protein, partial [Oscillospiraceae bacterium]|nr:ATP-binding cassette domain-containing protein [Oscillospiraceae bacterium]
MNLEIKNGCFGYSKQKMILNHINFCAESGDLVAILGPNGAGKTTL